MHSKPIFASVILTALIAGCSPAEEAATSKAEVVGATEMRDSTGTSIGTVDLERGADGLTLKVALAGMEPGVRAIHLHTAGICEAPDFTTAGGHLNPSGATHGSLSEGGKHLGDLPNIEIPDTGELIQSIALDGDTEANLAAIFDADGTAVMIHAGPDDYQSDPAGAAGPRIACGVLTPPN